MSVNLPGPQIAARLPFSSVSAMQSPMRKHAYLQSLPAVILAAASLFPVSAALANGQQVLPGHVHAIVRHLAPVGRVTATEKLRLALGLPLRDEAGLNELLGQLYDPASPNYRKWWTPQQLAERFGASEADCQAVRDWARAHNLTVTATHPNRLVVDVEGAAADVEAALHVVLLTYQHPTETRRFFAPDREPSVDLAARLLSISGLDNFSIPHPKRHIRALDAKAAPRSGSGPSGTYIGGDFRAAYMPGTSLNGTGQSIGLLEFDGFYASDITAYESQAGLPNTPLTVVAVDGGVSTPGSGNDEVCLDIEVAIAMAPGIARVYVYEAPNPSPFLDLLSRMQTDNLSKQLSCSWGGGGPDAASENIFKLMSGQGQSFFNATGDSDAFTSSIPFPSDSTNITQVGATTLTTSGPGGSYVSETVWNWGLDQGKYVGSSGGVSSYYGIPGYQVPVSMALNQGSTKMRNVPDVALTGDNVYVRYNNGSAGGFGGTSCAAPLWAGVMALINQQNAANGHNSVGFMNPPVYTIGLGANYNLDFNDITLGNNTWPSSPSKYYATNGFDLCAGWGTPTVNLINALAGPPAPSIVSNALAITAESCPNGAVDPNETVTLTFGLKNIGGAPTTNLVATLQASGGVTSPTGPQSYGLLAAGGSASHPFTFKATGSCGGTLTATVQLQDGPANLGSIAFTIQLGVVTAAAPLNQAFDSVAAPALPAGWTSALVSGSQDNWVTTAAANASAPNAVFITDNPATSENALVSPAFSIASSSAQLTFQQNYALQASQHGRKTYYDGGVLEIKIGNGAFTDIITAGGSFITGGYNVTLATGNPLAGSSAWGGDSGGWVTTTVALPASAAGQTVQLRWACATAGANASGGAGWYVDSVVISDTVAICCGAPTNSLPAFSAEPTNQVAIAGATVSFSAAASGSPAPAYQWLFDTTNMLAGKTAAVLTLTNVQSSQAGLYTVLASNIAGIVTGATAQLTVLLPPTITSQPTNLTVIPGATAAFSVAASGSLPLAYHWQFGNATLAAATTSTLQLSNVQPAQAGNYRVIVTNVAGAITSVPASLRVLVAPLLSSITKTGATASVSFPSVGGLVYTLEYENVLTGAVWAPIPPATTGSDGIIVLQDTNATNSSRFYRLRTQ
ncbi:MAG: hypothetical protein C5B50_02150 [Verrucomicrobia bacterium]|nr:MAG: hypothetical protein C5B50_02150 [Verrucomicrobiota bacterium]